MTALHPRMLMTNFVAAGGGEVGGGVGCCQISLAVSASWWRCVMTLTCIFDQPRVVLRWKFTLHREEACNSHVWGEMQSCFAEYNGQRSRNTTKPQDLSLGVQAGQNKVFGGRFRTTDFHFSAGVWTEYLMNKHQSCHGTNCEASRAFNIRRGCAFSSENVANPSLPLLTHRPPSPLLGWTRTKDAYERLAPSVTNYQGIII
jgi:hypothetical protein